MARCTAITGSGERCKGVPVRGSTLCAAHHPETQAARRAGSRRGGRGSSAGARSGELAALRAKTATLYEEVRAGTVDPKVGAVLSQVANTEARIMELERRWFEVLEVEARLDALEKRLDPRRIS